MLVHPSRRSFLKTCTAAAAAAAAPGILRAADQKQPLYKISLAEWSLHRTIRGGKLDNLDFARVTREEFDIEAIEYVNQFFKDKAKDSRYLAELNKRAADHDVKQLLIMVDGEGQLGAADEAERKTTVDNHKKWVDAAKQLGCHSIRVNAASSGSYEEQQQRAADGLRRLSEYAQPLGLNVIVENHGGLSSNGQWLADTIRMVGMDNCGTLPDFGNFTVDHQSGETYDRYKGVEELMPFAKAVSAKSYGFDDSGNETTIDYSRMMGIVLDHDYHGYVGIEWEGDEPDEFEGIRLTKQLLERVREQKANS